VAFVPTDSTGASATATRNVLPAAATATATSIGQDATTQRNRMGTYGGQGDDVIDGPSSLPGYAGVTPSGQANCVWFSSTTDPRALQTSGGSSRIAACWYTPATFTTSSFSVGVDLSDGQVHDLELYFVDWDSGGARSRCRSATRAPGRC
jgi:hypothetical protein